MLFLFFGLSAQDESTFEVRGVIRDAVTEESLPFANVFFSGTTYGTTSDKNGEFVLRPATKGTYNLVISFMGFKPFKKQVVLNKPGIVEVVVEMVPEPRFLGGVTVTANKDRKWRRLLKMFKNIFLGTSTNSESCIILNEEVLFLEYEAGTGLFEAYAGEPLIIENRALGYKISYVLASFRIFYNEGYSIFSGYPVFEEMEGNERTKRRWIEARDKAFYGSTEHFFRELYQGNAHKAGYRVHEAQDKRTFRNKNREELEIDTLVTFNEDGIRKELAFEDFIYVKYLHQLPDKGYLANLPNTTPAEIRYGKIQQSWLKMPEGEDKLIFEQSGFWVNPAAFTLEGYWSFLKMADLLPINYQPSSH